MNLMCLTLDPKADTNSPGKSFFKFYFEQTYEAIHRPSPTGFQRAVDTQAQW